MGILKNVRGPLIAILGVAAVAGLIFLAYKLYKARQSGKNVQSVEDKTVSSLFEDFRKSAPNLFDIPGWAESVKGKISDAVNSLELGSLVNKLGKMKAEILEKQASIGQNNHDGKGGTLLTILGNNYGKTRHAQKARGGGVIHG